MSFAENNPTKPASSSRKPSWWTDSLETSWAKVKLAALEDWHRLVKDEKRIANRIDEDALAFGYGARETYLKLQVWGGQLEETLKADWRKTGHEADQAWDHVRDTVRHGWERAAVTAKAAASDTMKAVRS